jgi:hypothetical protein
LWAHTQSDLGSGGLVDGHLGYQFALRAFEEPQAKAGVESYRLHDYRKSVARRLEQGGIPRSTAADHWPRTEHVFRQYPVGEDEDLRKALSTVEGNGKGPARKSSILK